MSALASPITDPYTFWSYPSGTSVGKLDDRLPHERTPGGEAETATATNRTITLKENPPSWLQEVLASLDAFAILPANWDSYGAKAVSAKIIQAASNLLVTVSTDATPRPSVVPMARGGIQIEWHISGIDLEVMVRSPESFAVTFEDLAGNEWERSYPASNTHELTRAVESLCG